MCIHFDVIIIHRNLSWGNNHEYVERFLQEHFLEKFNVVYLKLKKKLRKAWNKQKIQPYGFGWKSFGSSMQWIAM